MQPYISIIMAVYNNEKYFPIAVNSIINQTFTDWELVIVDDGSTDRTPQIADDFANQDSRIKVIHQENQWIYRSYNNGYAAASGKYVFIVNSDDTINPDSLQRIHDVADKSNADMIVFNLAINQCDNNQRIINSDMYNLSSLLKNDFVFDTKEVVHEKWLFLLQHRLLSRQCVYKASIAQHYKYDDKYYYADQFYNIKIAQDINIVAGTSYVVYNYFHYINSYLNASEGKYYGYEHNMFNEFYLDYKMLFDSWNVLNNESQNVLINQRMQQLTTEIRAYLAMNCPLSIDEKLDKIMFDLSDGVVYSCALKSNRIEEYESRILSGFREIFIKEIPSENCKYYFIYELLDRLLAYEKTDEDMEMIRKAVYHPLNPHNIGECFYKKLSGE